VVWIKISAADKNIQSGVQPLTHQLTSSALRGRYMCPLSVIMQAKEPLNTHWAATDAQTAVSFLSFSFSFSFSFLFLFHFFSFADGQLGSRWVRTRVPDSEVRLKILL
jgi:hypothetical protein